MSKNKETQTNFERTEYDKNGKPIHIYRQRTVYLTKEQVIERAKDKEKK